MHGLSDWQLWVLTHLEELLIGVPGTVVAVVVAVALLRRRKGRK